MPQVQQVGGNHYNQQLGQCPNCQEPLQHWDWAARMPYLEGNATKYISRHSDKNKLNDILKAASYLQKIVQLNYADEYAALPANKQILGRPNRD